MREVALFGVETIERDGLIADDAGAAIRHIDGPRLLVKHAALMARFPNMQHDEAYMVHVDPDKTGEIVWHFNRAGRFKFACLIAGHYEAGMRGTITVTPKQGGAK